MSLNLLTVPNVYELFCGSITQISGPTGATGTTPSFTPTIVAAQNLVASPSITATQISIRGVTGPIPVGPPITLNVLQSGVTNVVTMVIPQFTITFTGATGLTNVQLTVANTWPVDLLPLYNTTWIVPFQTSTLIYAESYITLSQTGILTWKPSADLSPFGPSPLGFAGDVYLSYTAASIP